MASKTAIDIERLLQWAYRDELPKRGLSSAEGIWDQIEEFGQRGGIDVGHGSAQRYPHFGLPHPDALKIEKAVSALKPLILDWQASRDALLGDLIAIFAARDTLLLGTLNTAALVTMHANAGTRPGWREKQPRANWIEAERGPRNRPKVVGECRGRDLYTVGSYCPLQWEPSPISIAQTRADYVCWHRGLCELADTLELDEHQALPPAADPQPWHDNTPPGRIFAVGEVSKERLPLAPQRDRAGPPPRHGRHGRVTIRTPEKLDA